MCGRYSLYTDEENQEIIKIIRALDQKYPENNILYMAGIYNEFKGENRFTILTAGANNSIADVHNRMPVILPGKLSEEWILSEKFALSYIHSNMPLLRREIST